MFVRSTRKITPDEELCLTYCSVQFPYEKRVDTFRNWIKPGVGFRCEREWCSTMRSNKELRAMERHVEAAYDRASELVSLQSMPMAVAADKVMPQSTREQLLTKYERFPLYIQHNDAAKLWVMQGSY
jgi:hypothetical protein